ncbi:thiamine pyrophosphate-dependent enzyme [Euzebya tangerina]|uniref:thiamine pyrophosphate-dependent enzyme n=1 Tax=Euzebya tangerina TaxID=591198 RepID=UPI002F2FAD82
MTTRVEIVQSALTQGLARATAEADLLEPDQPVTGSLTAQRARDLLADMLTSRSLDVAARRLKAEGHSYYTISSAGHEINAVLGALTRTTDPAFLHYRSGGFVVARSRLAPDVDAVADTVRSFIGAKDDPIAQGRHKVWGSAPLWIPPQTSTIASHLPKSVGTAVAIERARRLGLTDGSTLPVPEDSIVVCSFGDASANHASALAGINAARYAQRRGAHAPVLFVCEDNGLGISVDTPKRWIAGTFGELPHLRYVHATGPVDQVWTQVEEAVEWCRETRAPVFLHLDTVRLWGHAGSDVERMYRTQSAIEADEARDPILAAGRRLIAVGAIMADEATLLAVEVDEHVQRTADRLVGSPGLQNAHEVMAPLAPFSRARAAHGATTALSPSERIEVWDGDLPEDATAPARRTMGALINATLHDELARRPNALVFGEDVARKGGVYHVTAGLLDRFGHDRVFDTLLDETTILGVAQGAGIMGFLPIPEIQYLAYLHNALDQIRGEAASLSFFSSGQFTNPMVIRIAGLAYQKGFGGHFHNDNAIGALRDIPGLAIACPSRGDDAARMLRGAISMADTDGRVVAFLEPITLYHAKDLHEDGDELWLCDYPPPGSKPLLPGEVGVYATGGERPTMTIATYGNGVRMALQAAQWLAAVDVRAEVVDLRWLNPLPLDALATRVDASGRLLVVDECRATGGGIADAVISGLAERTVIAPMRSVRAADSFVPLGPAAETVLVDTGKIINAAMALGESPSGADRGPFMDLD